MTSKTRLEVVTEPMEKHLLTLLLVDRLKLA